MFLKSNNFEDVPKICFSGNIPSWNEKTRTNFTSSIEEISKHFKPSELFEPFNYLLFVSILCSSVFADAANLLMLIFAQLRRPRIKTPSKL